MASKDNINPDHYKSSTSLECIEAMEVIFGSEALVNFCLCNAWKYIWRWKNKNGSEDLKKAEWYVNKALNLLSTVKSYDTTNDIGLAVRMYDYITRWSEEIHNSKRDEIQS